MNLGKVTTDLMKKAKGKRFLPLLLVGATIVGILIGRSIVLRTRLPEYEIAKVQRTDLTQTIEASGKIKAEEAVDLHFQTYGKLSWIGVKEGDRVKKWQAVAGQDKRSLEKNLRKDLNTFEKELRDYGQAIEDNPLVNQRFKRILEQANFDLTSSVIDVEIKNLSLELATLVSPIEGIVVNVDIPVAGVNVTATDTITVVNPQSLYFEVEADEADIGMVRTGQKSKLILDAFPNEEIESEVIKIAFEASTSEGGGTVFRIKLSLPLDESSGKYRLGLSGESTIVIAEKQDVLTIPVEAVKTENETEAVDILVDGKVRTKPVETGMEGETAVEVVSGLSEGETVITGIKEKE